MIKHLMYVPFTGLGMYGGYRGRRWFKNRLKVFKQFVVPSLLAQTSDNFIVWISFMPDQRGDKLVEELENYLSMRGIDCVFTYSGVCFWDDKHPDEVAKIKLIDALHGSMGELINAIGECDYVYMTIQPSDDCYHRNFVKKIQRKYFNEGHDAIGFAKGYIMDYKSGDIKQYNPKTNPPFFTIKFKRDIFIDPLKHMKFTGPYKSHEYIGDYLKYKKVDIRGFLVGTHGENISTIFNHPYAGKDVGDGILYNFGLNCAEPLKIKYSIRKRILRLLPHRVQRKIRYIFGEKFWNIIYNWLRS